MFIRPLTLSVPCMALAGVIARGAESLPELVLTQAGTRVGHSCRVVIAPGTVIATTSITSGAVMEIVVEYFQNDGHAALSITIEPAGAAP